MNLEPGRYLTRDGHVVVTVPNPDGPECYPFTARHPVVDVAPESTVYYHEDGTCSLGYGDAPHLDIEGPALPSTVDARIDLNLVSIRRALDDLNLGSLRLALDDLQRLVASSRLLQPQDVPPTETEDDRHYDRFRELFFRGREAGGWKTPTENLIRELTNAMRDAANWRANTQTDLRIVRMQKTDLARETADLTRKLESLRERNQEMEKELASRDRTVEPRRKKVNENKPATRTL